ncbi:MAG TPA: OmpA family protein [Kofleriaceae bacterium]|jgi:OOP family OmpA-OmpF porin|nr:OmpA family protein [Kofleriaceae bacterium]
MKTWLVIGALGLASCGGPITFQGQSTLAVNGTPPAPPPPPVVEVKPPPRVEVRDNKIEIHEKIQFDLDKATIKPESFSLMNEIGDVITKNPQIKQIRIEGYASADGDAKHNKKLSDQRAKSVMKYLVDHKIPATSLSAIGYGVEHPIADNATEDGREKNRRVEFAILAQDVTKKKVEIDPATGKEKVVEEDHEMVKAPDDAAPTDQATQTNPKTKKPAKPTKTPKKGS